LTNRDVPHAEALVDEPGDEPTAAAPVATHVHGPKLTAVLERPDHGNRLDRATIRGLVGAVARADEDERIRVLVITGSGDCFCAGGRIDGFADGDADAQLAFARDFTSLHERLAECRVPTVAAVNGRCAAAGMSLLHACDLAVATEDATFSYPEIQAGLFPMLALAATQSSLPSKVAFELFYTGRPLDAATARQLHLINDVVPAAELGPTVDRLVYRLAQHRPQTLSIGRRAYHAMAPMARTEAFRYAQWALVGLLDSGVPRDSEWA
jgi:enoyl-CoA hydratase/carnithine racemase